jgi:TolA-binding protein
MKKKIVNALTMAYLLGFGVSLDAQTQSTETARKHLESGVQFYEQARYKQALNDFEIVVSMGDPDYADDALLRIGEYYLDVEEDFAKAREYFDRVLQNYPTKDAAPGAYYYMGMVTLRSSFGAQALDDAVANFQRVLRLYPQSPWVPAALRATGLALERRGSWEEALDSYFRVMAEYPDSRWAAGAQLALGRCLVRLGDPVQGMVEIQMVRDRYPNAGEADEALDWLTHLFRLYGYPELGRPVSYRTDPAFDPKMKDKFKDIESIKISAQGVQVLERGRKRVLTFETNGRLAGTKSAADPKGMVVDPRGVLVIANEKGLLIGERPVILSVPEEKGPKPLENVRAAVRDRLGDTFVYDNKQKKVLRFGPEGKVKGSFPDSTPREVMRLELDRNGNIIFLEKKDRTVAVYSPAGRRIARIQPRGEKWDLKKPTDFAVDPAGYFYLLDEDLAEIIVFDPSYKFVTKLGSQSLGGGILEKPVALDVDGSGDIYVYDDDEKAILRFH